MGSCAQFWGPQYKGDLDVVERVLKMMKELEHLSCEEMLREMAVLGLEKRRLRGMSSTSITACRESTGVEPAPFTGARARPRGSGHKMEARRFPLSTAAGLCGCRSPGTGCP